MSNIRLFKAIGAGDLQTTRDLLEGKQGIDVDTIRASDDYKRTLLHTACKHLSLQIVKFLVHEKKADVNALDVDRWTPLYEACLEDATEIAEVLLANGANVNTKTTPPIRHTALHAACRYGSPLLVQMLLNHGARINASNGDGRTPLSSACCYSRIDVIKVLLANNADRSIKDNLGYEPAALLDRHSEVFESYDKWPLATSELTQPTASAHRENGGVMVKLNPRLSQHQHTLALKTLLLVRRLPVHEVSLEILGFLTPAAVERIFLPS